MIHFTQWLTTLTYLRLEAQSQGKEGALFRVYFFIMVEFRRSILHKESAEREAAAPNTEDMSGMSSVLRVLVFAAWQLPFPRLARCVYCMRHLLSQGHPDSKHTSQQGCCITGVHPTLHRQTEQRQDVACQDSGMPLRMEDIQALTPIDAA